MRVLFVSTPGAGHISPLVPLIEAFVDAGDDVLVASGPEASEVVARSGARFEQAGVSQAEVIARLAARTRGAPGDGLPPDRIIHYFLPRAFGEIAVDEMIDDVLRLGREFRPEVLIFEAFALAGPLAADVLAVPAITHLFGPTPPLDAVVLANDAVSPIWRAHGRSVPGWAGIFRDMTIQISPPSLEVAEVPVGESMYLRPTPGPKAPASRGERPLVYVTFGTLFNANLDLFRRVLEALGDEPIDVVATVGRDQDPAALLPHPANARVERFIPQADLLPTCSAIVHHGGAGTTFGALAHGVPQVILPQGADNFEHAAMCASAGTAVSLEPDGVNAETLVDAVRRVLADPNFAVASNRCAAEITAMPDAPRVAESVREWVGRR
jgi:UDP:flavonoid glycosyltransferase YjiC (YdhE family)